jgi:hypothetical protein
MNTQATHDDLPGWHILQEEAEIVPVSNMNLPITQLLQVFNPYSSPYFPTGQSSHNLEHREPDCPSPHDHSVSQ